MAIRFKCSCGATIRVKDEMAGKVGECPKCGKIVKVPAPAAQPPSESEEKIRFACQCGKKLVVPANAAGGTGKCPDCGAVMKVPSPSTEKLLVLEEDTAPPAPETPPPPDPTATEGLSRLDIGYRQNCPSCGREYPGSATICTDCRIDMTTGERVRRTAPRRQITLPWKPILAVVGIAVVAVGGYAVYENYLSDWLRDIGKPSSGAGGTGSTPTTGGALRGFTDAEIRGLVTRVQSNMRSVATAIEFFNIDHNLYPPFATGALSVNGDLGQEHPAFSLPTFCRPDPSGRLKTLSSPTSDQVLFSNGPSPSTYLKSYPRDPFSKGGNATFLYWCVNHGHPDPSGRIVPEPRNGSRNGWILVSAGPDGDYDFAGEWHFYDPPLRRYSRDRRYESQNQMQHNAFVARLQTGRNRRGSALTYDPTNGLVSDGDIWRVKQ